VAQAFDLAGISNTVGGPSFAFFAKGGIRECLRRVATLFHSILVISNLASPI